MKAVVATVLLVAAALLAIITLGGWEHLQSPGIGAATIFWAALYVAFAFLVMNWGRGILPVCAVLAMLMAIFAFVSAPNWFARDKDGLDSPALPEELLGLLTVIVIPVSFLLIVVAMLAFNQQWHVEEERPIAGGPEDRGDGEPVAQEPTDPNAPPKRISTRPTEWNRPSTGEA